MKATIKNCFISSGFYEDENDDELKSLEHIDITKEDYELCLASKNGNRIAAKLT